MSCLVGLEQKRERVDKFRLTAGDDRSVSLLDRSAVNPRRRTRHCLLLFGVGLETGGIALEDAITSCRRVRYPAGTNGSLRDGETLRRHRPCLSRTLNFMGMRDAVADDGR